MGFAKKLLGGGKAKMPGLTKEQVELQSMQKEQMSQQQEENQRQKTKLASFTRPAGRRLLQYTPGQGLSDKLGG